MKKFNVKLLAAFFCSILLVAAKAQSPSLESVLPADAQKNLPGLQADISFIIGKVQQVNPGFKKTATLNADFKAAVDALKKQKPALQSVVSPQVTPTSYDELIVAKTKQLGAQSAFVKVLTTFKDGVIKANDNAGVVTVMVNIIKSPVFAQLSAADKQVLYSAFSSTKIVFDNLDKINVVAMANNPTFKRGVGGYVKTGDDDDDKTVYSLRGRSICTWLCTMAGAVAGCVGGPVGAGIGAGIGCGAGLAACS